MYNIWKKVFVLYQLLIYSIMKLRYSVQPDIPVFYVDYDAAKDKMLVSTDGNEKDVIVTIIDEEYIKDPMINYNFIREVDFTEKGEFMVFYAYLFDENKSNEIISIDITLPRDMSIRVSGAASAKKMSCVEDEHEFEDWIENEEDDEYKNIVMLGLIATFKTAFIKNPKLIARVPEMIENFKQTEEKHLLIAFLMGLNQARRTLSIVAKFPIAAKRYWAGSKIVKVIEQAYCNPETELCKQRLMREFTSMSAAKQKSN